MAMFHSYVKLPEGKCDISKVSCFSMTLFHEAMMEDGTASTLCLCQGPWQLWGVLQPGCEAWRQSHNHTLGTVDLLRVSVMENAYMAYMFDQEISGNIMK